MVTSQQVAGRLFGLAGRAGRTPLRRRTGAPSDSRPRIALYSHDAQGLGHIRRNLAIASALAPRGADVLLLTGAPEAAAMRRPVGVDLVAVPALAKDADGGYDSRHLSVGLDATLLMRSEVLRAAATTFDPDLLVVDKHPWGFRGELTSALEQARRQDTRVVLGLRDVMDDPDSTRAEWRRDRGDEALARFYDEVWTYGDPQVHDVAAELGLRVPVQATGYLANGRVPTADQTAGRTAPRGLPPKPFVLCVLGGGSDGAELATAFARAPMPAGHRGVLVTGPHLDPAVRHKLKAQARGREDLRVHTYRDDLVDWYGHAAGVVAMGGYNTVAEVLASGRPLLVVPRVHPRAEQLVRASAMARLGLLRTCHPDDLGPAHLGAAMTALVTDPTRPSLAIDLDGLTRIPGLAARHLAARRGLPTSEVLSA